MSSSDIISKLTSDNVLAQRFHCAGCQKLIAQVEDPQLVPVKNKARGDSPTEQAVGVFCKDCREDELRSKEGPRQAVYTDARGDIRIDFYDNLVPIKSGEAAKSEEEQ
jgi:hypothetical protein